MRVSVDASIEDVFCFAKEEECFTFRGIGCDRGQFPMELAGTGTTTGSETGKENTE